MDLFNIAAWKLVVCACCLLALGSLVAAPASAITLGVSADGRFFTVNGKSVYLNGISYYSGTSVDDPKDLKLDLDDMVKNRFNWIRVWTFWGADIAVTDPNGQVREPGMSRLKTIITECNKRRMIVDVTMSHGNHPAPSNQAEHLACARTLAAELKPYRNVYIDVGNERDVGDARYVSLEDVGELITAIKAIDPQRICTASSCPGSEDGMKQHLEVGKLDFIAPHLCRDDGCSAKTIGTVKELAGWMKALGRRVPIHLQEPFRRGYTDYQPTVEDFYRDDSGARIAEAAGWCLHNGSSRRGSGEQQRSRSFGMGKEHGRLYAQLDEVELEVCKNIDDQIGGTNLNTRRYQAEYEEQVQHKTGRKDGLAWSADVKLDQAGCIAVVPWQGVVPPGRHRATWKLMIDDVTSANEPVVVLDVFAGSRQLAQKILQRKDFTRPNEWRNFSLRFTGSGQSDLQLRAGWLGNSGLKVDHITLTIGRGP